MANVRPKAAGTQWSAEVLDKLYELVGEPVCEMKLTSKRAAQHVTLSVEGVDVASSLGELVDQVPDPDILSIPTLTVPASDEPTSLFVSHVESVDQIYTQLNDVSWLL